MKKLLSLLTLFSLVTMADTPPPGTVKAKTYSGDGNTAITATSSSLNVNVTNFAGIGTVDQGAAGTDPWLVSVSDSALPANACKETGGHLASIDTKLTSPLTVAGTFWQVLQPVSVASLPLPSGAATAAKQPALGTAGSASTDVITVQGIASMTALKTDSSATTQPVSGTVTANAGTGTFTVDASGHTVPVSGDFWQSTQPVSGVGTFTVDASGHTVPISAASLPLPTGAATDASVTALQVGQGSTTSGEKGTLTLGAVTTGSPSYTNAQSSPFSLTTAGALRIDGSATTQPVSGTFWQATQPVSLSTLPALTAGSALIGKVGIDQTTPGTTNLVALAANQSVNVAQINGTTPLMGNGTAGTGSQRVTIASDNTAFSVNAVPKTPAALTVKQAAISVGTSAVRLTNDGSAPPSTRTLLVAQLLSTSTANCYFGSSGVTTTSTTRGVQMFAGQTLSFSQDAGDYYGICDTAAQTIFITEQE